MNYLVLVINLDVLTNDKDCLSTDDQKALIDLQEQIGIRIILYSQTSLGRLKCAARQLHLAEYGGYAVTNSNGELDEHTHTVAYYIDEVPDPHNQRARIVKFKKFSNSLPDHTEVRTEIKKVLEHLSISRGETVFIGGNEQDVELMQSFGMGVAIADAPEVSKSCADYVTTGRNDGAIAHLIKKVWCANDECFSYDIDEINDKLQHSMIEQLGIHCTKVTKGYVEGTMPVDHRTCNPMGLIHGGANLAFAETLAGVGSFALLGEDYMQVGMQVSGNHIATTADGDTLRGEATVMHKGKSTHVWDIEIYSEGSGKLISTVRVLNSIFKRR